MKTLSIAAACVLSFFAGVTATKTRGDGRGAEIIERKADPIHAATNEPLDPTYCEIMAPLWNPDIPRRPWNRIILHHSGSNRCTVEGITDWHVNKLGWSAMGYHFIVLRDGSLHVGERWRLQREGAHCKGANEDAIGICLIGNFDESPAPDAQRAAAAALVELLRAELGIAKEHVTDHRDHRATACPGKHFGAREIVE